MLEIRKVLFFSTKLPLDGRFSYSLPVDVRNYCKEKRQKIWIQSVEKLGQNWKHGRFNAILSKLATWDSLKHIIT